MFRNVQVLRKQVENQNKGLWQMPNRYLNDFGKLLRFRSVQLLRKQFMNENKARRVRKKGK